MDRDKDKLDPKELWIGDSIQDKKTGIVGTYDGMTDGKIILRKGDRTIIGEAVRFRLFEENTVVENDLAPEVQHQVNDRMMLDGAELDLHIAALDPSRVGDNPILLRNFQLQKCKEFIDHAIAQRLHSVVIIHGKGAGVLESDVLSFLANVDEVSRIEDVHKGGAKRIVF